MLEWTAILFLITLRVYQEGTKPSRAVARRIFEKRSEEKVFPGMVIEGDPRFEHSYRQTSHGLKHGISIQGSFKMRPSLRRKAIGKLKRNKKIIALVIINIMVIGVLTQAGFLAPMAILAVRTWNAPGPGPANWSDGANWIPMTGIGGPANGDDAVFNATSVINCTIDINTNNLASFLMDTGYMGIVMLGVNTLQIQSRLDLSNFTGTQGTFDAQTGSVIFSGSWDTSSILFTLTRGASTVNATGTGSIRTRDVTTNALNHVTCGAPGKTTTLLSNISTYGTLTIGLGELTGSTVYLRTATDPLVNTGILNSIIIYYMDDSVTVVATMYGADLQVRIPDGFVATVGGGILVTVGGSLFVYSKDTNGTCTLDTVNNSITVAEDIRIGSGTGHGIFDCGSSAIDCDRDVLVNTINSYILGDTSTWTFARHWTNASTHASFDMGTSEVTADGPAQTIAMNGDAFYVLIVAGTGTKSFTENLTTHDVRATVSRQITITAGITWTVTAGGRIYADSGYTLTLRSSVADSQWLMVAGAGVTATRVDVKDSDASGGSTIDATDGTNTDSDNNLNWDFGRKPQMVGHHMIKGIDDEIVSHSQLFGVRG